MKWNVREITNEIDNLEPSSRCGRSLSSSRTKVPLSLQRQSRSIRRTFAKLACSLAVSLLLPAAAVSARNAAAPVSGAEDELLPVVISGGSDHAVKHWDATGKLLGAIGLHTDPVTSLAYAQGELICAASNGKVKGIDLSSGKTNFDVKAHPDGATVVAVSSDASLMATGGTDSILRLWEGKTGHFLALFPKAHGSAVTALQLTSDHSRMVSGSADRIIRIWRITGDSKHPVIEYEANIIAHDDAVNAISLSPNDKLIASVSGDGSLKVWNISGGAMVQRMRLNAPGLSVAFSPDGHTIATGAADGKVRLWNPDNGMALPFTGSHERGVTALAWSTDGKILVSGGEDKTLRYWNLSTGRQIARITAHDGSVRAIVLP